MNEATAVWGLISAVRGNRPLVVNITNNVVTNLTANALLALGASPAMTHAAEDAAELARLAGALVLNIGTPQTAYLDSMFAAGKAAAAAGVPIVLDPVAAGATSYRSRAAKNLLDELPVGIVRGNASEIMSVSGLAASGKGVDSLHGSQSALEAAKNLARAKSCVVCVSGEKDYVTDGAATLVVSGGHEMMPRVTGLGCVATALCGAFAAVSASLLDAAGAAMAVMGVAGEMAGAKAAGPGSFQVHFLDALYALDEAGLNARISVKRQ